MGPSEKSFSQVKAILGKLDRSIDELRARRTGEPAEGVSEAIPAAVAAVGAVAPTKPPLTLGRAEAAPPAVRNTSPYGRATPLNGGRP